jgi:hypothetical protein
MNRLLSQCWREQSTRSGHLFNLLVVCDRDATQTPQIKLCAFQTSRNCTDSVEIEARIALDRSGRDEAPLQRVHFER